jgi:hypothetical protein
LVGGVVTAAEQERRPLGEEHIALLAEAAGLPSLDAPLDAGASIAAKRTPGSTGPQFVRAALAELSARLDRDFPREPA